MTKDFLEKRLNELSKLDGYEKPPKISGSLKLDSNENFVISKLFQQDLIDVAKKKCDVREYPLGGTEKLINQLSKSLKVPVNMIGVGNGSDQILDLFLANFCTKQTKILTTKSLPEIGREFSNRDHTTIIHSVKTIEKLKEKNPDMNDNINKLKNIILYNKEI